MAIARAKLVILHTFALAFCYIQIVQAAQIHTVHSPGDSNLTLIRESLATPSRINCTSLTDCQQHTGFICENNTCICNPDNSIATPSGCVGQAEKACINNKCTPNAECLTVLGEHNHDNYTTPDKRSGGDAKNKTSPYVHWCKCTKGYYPTPFGSCDNASVDCTQLPCYSWAICEQNKACHCWDPNTRLINKVKISCTAKINEGCNANLTHSYEPNRHIVCVEGGRCVKNPDFVDGKQAETNIPLHCRCEDGLVANSSGACNLGHGMNCSAIVNGGNSSNLECDSEMRLACIQGKCECELLNVLDKAEGRCVGLPGASCSVPNITDDADLLHGPGNHPAAGTYLRGTCKTGLQCVPIGNGTSGVGAQGNENGTMTCKSIEVKDFNGDSISAANWVSLIVALGTVAVIITVICLIYVRGHSFVAFLQARFL